MIKSILAAAAFTLAASAVPAAAYDGEYRHHKSSNGYSSIKTYNKYDNDRRDYSDSDRRDWRVRRADRGEVSEHHEGRRWWHRRHHWNDDYAEYRPYRHHRRWWHYWD